jgi:hypothetical protein
MTDRARLNLGRYRLPAGFWRYSAQRRLWRLPAQRVTFTPTADTFAAIAAARSPQW